MILITKSLRVANKEHLGIIQNPPLLQLVAMRMVISSRLVIIRDLKKTSLKASPRFLDQVIRAIRATKAVTSTSHLCNFSLEMTCIYDFVTKIKTHYEA